MEHTHGHHEHRSHLVEDLRKEHKIEVSSDVVDKIRSKFHTNYFGLPPYALQASPAALAYQCRKPLQSSLLDGGDHQSVPSAGNDRPDSTSRKMLDSFSEEKTEVNYVAQRKVASALLTMVSNPLMLKHFLQRGGFEALLKLCEHCTYSTGCFFPVNFVP